MAKVEDWGDINDIVAAPLQNVAGDATWISVCCMWLTLPISCIQGVIGGLCKAFMAFFVIGCYCCRCIPQWLCCSGMGSAQCGRPCILAPAWWRYSIGGLVALIANSRSRLALFIWEWKAFGSSDHFWHGEGFWSVKYQECSDITKSQQKRGTAFACIQALEMPSMSLFLLATSHEKQGVSESLSMSRGLRARSLRHQHPALPLQRRPRERASVAMTPFIYQHEHDMISWLEEWAHLRRALHATLLDHGLSSYQERKQGLKALIASDWRAPKLRDFDDTERLRLMVTKCIFYMLFGVWLPEEDAKVLKGWRDDALYFVLPRLVHRFLLNFGIRKVKKLRVDSVKVIQKHGLEKVFEDMNQMLPKKFQRSPAPRFLTKACRRRLYCFCSRSKRAFKSL